MLHDAAKRHHGLPQHPPKSLIVPRPIGWVSIDGTGRVNEAQRGAVVFGQAAGAHIGDAVIKDGRIDMLAFELVARLGYSEYTTTDNVWRMLRPHDPRCQ